MQPENICSNPVRNRRYDVGPLSCVRIPEFCTAGDDLYLTHEFMAVMLGMRRPWVTETLHSLEGEGHIRATRGKVTIINRAGLLAEANGFYGVAERGYQKLLSTGLSR